MEAELGARHVSRRLPTGSWSSGAESITYLLNRLLQCGGRERLHHLASWLRLDHDHLAEHFTLACFCGRLDAGLEPAEPWDSEDPLLFHGVGGNAGEAVQELAADRLLELAALSDGLRNRTLGHGLTARFLSLHRRHCVWVRRQRNGPFGVAKGCAA